MAAMATGRAQLFSDSPGRRAPGVDRWPCKSWRPGDLRDLVGGDWNMKTIGKREENGDLLGFI